MESSSTIIRGITYTKLHVSEFEKYPEMYLFYYDFIKNIPYEVPEGIDAYQAYIERLKKNEYALVVATKGKDFFGAVYCTYDNFTDYIFIKQYVTAPGCQENVDDMANALWYFETKESKPTKGIMNFPLEEQTTFKFTTV